MKEKYLKGWRSLRRWSKNIQNFKKYRKYDRFGPFEEEVTGLTKGRKKRWQEKSDL